MSIMHKELANGRWSKLSFFEQLAHIGSEVERALNWKAKQNKEYAYAAFERALELIDLTILCLNTYSRRKEILRLREVLADYFFGTNEFATTDDFCRKYFSHFSNVLRVNA